MQRHSDANTPSVSGNFKGSTLIWVKTETGRAEIVAKALVQQRLRRNLLLLIDGKISEDTLRGRVQNVGPADFHALNSLGLIEPLSTQEKPAHGRSATLGSAAERAQEAKPLDYSSFTATLTQLISAELGLRGFTLTLAVEKASTAEALMEVGHRAVDQIRTRRGEAAAANAHRLLFGEELAADSGNDQWPLLGAQHAAGKHPSFQSAKPKQA